MIVSQLAALYFTEIMFVALQNRSIPHYTRNFMQIDRYFEHA